jgi:hypothetical protein
MALAGGFALGLMGQVKLGHNYEHLVLICSTFNPMAFICISEMPSTPTWFASKSVVVLPTSTTNVLGIFHPHTASL